MNRYKIYNQNTTGREFQWQSDPDLHMHPRFEAKQDGGSGEELEG